MSGVTDGSRFGSGTRRDAWLVTHHFPGIGRFFAVHALFALVQRQQFSPVIGHHVHPQVLVRSHRLLLLLVAFKTTTRWHRAVAPGPQVVVEFQLLVQRLQVDLIVVVDIISGTVV